MTDRITEWPPVIENYRTARGFAMFLSGGNIKISRPGEVNNGWLILQVGSMGRVYIYEDSDIDGPAVEWYDPDESTVDNRIKGFNRLLDLGLVRRIPDAPAVLVGQDDPDCSGICADETVSTDNLE